MKEIWKKIKDYDRYEVSNLGNIRSWCSHSGGVKTTPRLLKVNILNSGYASVALFPTNTAKKLKRVLVHRLVALAFIENPNNYPIVNHKDENKLNNNASNLEWCTCKENLSYSDIYTKGLITKNKTKASNAEKPIIAIKNNIQYEFKSIAEASRQVNSTRFGIRQVINKENRTCKGYTWKYKE